MEAGTQDNAIQGNYFGTNYSGTEQRSLRHGVMVIEGAGAQTIGGATAAASNCFANMIPSGWTSGITIDRAGLDSVVQHNTFGKLPSGTAVSSEADYAAHLSHTTVNATDNVIQRVDDGLYIQGSDAVLRAFGNRFSNCRAQAVCAADEAQLLLGNLSNTRTTDDGGNVFFPSNAKAIRNITSRAVKAE